MSGFLDLPWIGSNLRDEEDNGSEVGCERLFNSTVQHCRPNQARAHLAQSPMRGLTWAG